MSIKSIPVAIASIICLNPLSAIAYSDFAAEQDAFLGNGSFAAEQDAFLADPIPHAAPQPIAPSYKEQQSFVDYRYEPEPVYQAPAPLYSPAPRYEAPAYQAPAPVYEAPYTPPARVVYVAQSQPAPVYEAPRPLPSLMKPEGYSRISYSKPTESKSLERPKESVEPVIEAEPIVLEMPSTLKLLPIFDVNQMQYPLTLPGMITSLFGLRTHPVTGQQRFHAGLDIGAEHGTPVVSAFTGTVTHADWLGNYGKTVVVEHQGYRTVYAHLSEIKVRLGLVKQGTIIGSVGSTGLSTGPHLHFELQRKKDNSWEVIDPGNQIKVALKMLMEKAKYAVNVQPITVVPLDNQQDSFAKEVSEISSSASR